MHHHDKGSVFIYTTSALTCLCEQAVAEGVVALDVEFIRESTYIPQLALIQIAVSDTCAIVDPLEVRDLSALVALLGSDRVLKVLHAPAQDLEVMHWHSGVVPTRVFDTQIAAALTGLGEQLSYGRLVEALLGISLPKGESYSNWLQRPLTPAQVAYALDDVRYLHALHTLLAARLADMGRTQWAVDECRRFEAPDLYHRDSRTLFRRIRRGRSLSAQGLAILRELAAWRDQEACQRDRPPGSVLRDEVLVDIARKAPQTLADLQSLRGLPGREVERSGAVLIELVHRGLAVAEANRPTPARRMRLTHSEELMVKFLDFYLRILCQRQQVAPGYLASRAELEQLVRSYRQGQHSHPDSPLLEGWRGALVGREILAVLEGRLSLRLDPRTGCVIETPHPV